MLLRILVIKVLNSNFAALKSDDSQLAAIAYYMALPFLYLISVLPFRVLYMLSDFLCFVLYNVAGYRKSVVMTNLRNSFPEKSEAEINILAHKFYHHLCDITLETFKGLTISEKTMTKHCYFTGNSLDLLNSFADRNKSIILTMGHLGNWEWSGASFSILGKQKLDVIYHPLSNPYFDKLIYRMRTRFGTGLVEMQQVYKHMLQARDETTITAFISDQTAQPNRAHWMEFLNQDTPVFKGTEFIARKLNYPVVYAAVKKVKRGYYEMAIELLEEEPANTPEGYITELHTKRLEKDIIELPETWIWSHRRWKHKRQYN